MTWLAWRLHGFEVRFVVAMAALGAALMVVARLVLASDASRDVKIWLTIPVLPMVLLAIGTPALLGMFLGAPLVAAEVEAGTHRLAWMQSVSRQRWLLVHLAPLLVGSVAAMAVAAAGLGWALQPLFASAVGDPESPLQPGFFDATAIMPAASAVFAIGLGVLIGAFAQRTSVAMFATLVLFTVVRVAVAAALRPNIHPSLGPLDAFWSMQLVESSIYVALGAALLVVAWRQVTRALT